MTAKKKIAFAVPILSSIVFLIVLTTVEFARVHWFSPLSDLYRFTSFGQLIPTQIPPSVFFFMITIVALVLGRSRLSNLSLLRVFAVSVSSGLSGSVLMVLAQHLSFVRKGWTGFFASWVLIVGIVVLVQIWLRVFGDPGRVSDTRSFKETNSLKSDMKEWLIGTTWRERLFAIAGFLFAALIAALTLTPFEEHRYPYFELRRFVTFYQASLRFGALFGVPAFLVLRAQNMARWWSASLVGACIGLGCVLLSRQNFEARWFFLFLWCAAGALGGMAFWLVWRARAPFVSGYSVGKLAMMTFTVLVLIGTGGTLWYADAAGRSIREAVKEFKVSSPVARWWRCQGTSRPELVDLTRSWHWHYSWDGGAGPRSEFSSDVDGPGFRGVRFDLDNNGNLIFGSKADDQSGWIVRSFKLSKAATEKFARAVDDTGLLCQSSQLRKYTRTLGIGRYDIRVVAGDWQHEIVIDTCRTLPDPRAFGELFAALREQGDFPEEISWNAGLTSSGWPRCGKEDMQ